MGFGTIVGQIMFIIIIMIFVANALIQYNLSYTNYADAKSSNSKITTQLEKSSIKIINATGYGSDPKSINITLQNSGEYNLNKDLIDFYINNTRYNRTDFTVTILTDLVNPNLIDPGEYFKITTPNVGNGTHYLTIINEFSSKASTVLTIG